MTDKLDKQATRRADFILFMIRALNQTSVWCSRTHIQKACYLAQEMLGMEHDYKFVKYYYGPYCFKLSEHLEIALIKSYVHDQIIHREYGPSFRITDRIKEHLNSIEGERTAELEKINFVAEWFGGKKAADLEKLTSVYMVMREVQPDNLLHIEEPACKKIIAEVQLWKPHLSAGEIRDAIEVLREKHQEAQELLAAIGHPATDTPVTAN